MRCVRALVSSTAETPGGSGPAANDDDKGDDDEGEEEREDEEVEEEVVEEEEEEDSERASRSERDGINDVAHPRRQHSVELRGQQTATAIHERR
jgi:hypothetical protein